MRTLSESEKELWKRVANTVRPLDQAGSGPEMSAGFRAMLPIPAEFNPVLDLHGMTVHAAHAAALNHVSNAALDKRFKFVIIITGLSGQIREEFPRWFDNHTKVRSIKTLRGGGAWEVWLKKDTSTRKS